ncbi:alanine--glyoxylate aminotransferase family protein, partial [Candidatus Sumerlaeota bacterium]|nr:alanine--glyoxylate aminotransferase family protein [Candidatus Sumerlaeota bacterium]
GTLAMEASVAGVLSPGDKVITLEAGKFGQRWGGICKAYGMDVISLQSEWGHTIEPAEVELTLAKNAGVKAVYATLCETSTAVLNDVKMLGKIAGETGAILVVDAISGLAADRLESDAWGVDIVVGSSQKALMLPPGLAFASVSPKARKMIETAKCPAYYVSLKKALKSLEENTTAYTPAVSLIVGLNEALAMIREEGIEKVWARHERLHNALRAGGQALGLTLFSKCPSNTVVAYDVPAGVTYKDISRTLRDKYGITIAGGQDHIKGKIFRMAAMGWADEKDVIHALGALEATLTSLGHKIPQPGAGVAAALKSLGN